MKAIGYTVAILAILGSLWGIASFIDGRYAKAAEQKALERRLDYKIEKDQLIGMRDQLFQLQREYPTPVRRPAVIDKQMKELDADLEMQKNKVKALERGNP